MSWYTKYAIMWLNFHIKFYITLCMISMYYSIYTIKILSSENTCLLFKNLKNNVMIYDILENPDK